ncbi:MAG: thiamine pyrophosphate-dependent enzyme [Anaerolineae bacterium]
MPTYQDNDQLSRVFAALVRRLNTKPDQAEQIAGLGSVLRFYVTEPEATVTLNWTKRPLKGEMGPSKLAPTAEVWTSADALHNLFAGQLSVGDFLAQSRVEGDTGRWLNFGAWPMVVDAYTQTATRLGVIAPAPRQRAPRTRRAPAEETAPSSIPPTPFLPPQVGEEGGAERSEAGEGEGGVTIAALEAPAEAIAPTEVVEAPVVETALPEAQPTPHDGGAEQDAPPAAAAPAEEIAAPEKKASGRGRRGRGKGKAAEAPAEASAPELPPQVVEAQASDVVSQPEAPVPMPEDAAPPVELLAPQNAEAQPPVVEAEAARSESPPVAPDAAPPDVAPEPPAPPEAIEAQAAATADAPAPEPPAPAKPGGQKKKQERGRKDGKGKPAEAAAAPPPSPVEPTAPPAAPKTRPPDRGRERGQAKQGKAGPAPSAPRVQDTPSPAKAPGNGRPVAPPPPPPAPVTRPFHPEALPHTPIPLVEGEPHPRQIERHDQALPVDEAPLRLEMLRRMTLIRAVETRLAEELAAGALPLSDLDFSQGQEGVAVGACFALRPDDHVVTTHRSLGIFMGRGSDVNAVVAEVYGKSTGLDGGKAGPASMADRRVGALASSVVGASTILAAGWGLSARLQGTDRVALCFLGEGASNQGMFHESLNFASVRDLPLVFVLINNGVAGATPSGETSRLENVAQRAVAYGIGSITIDGADVWAVYRSVRAAVRLARSGGGPTLIEARVSRLVADEPERYDPVVRLYNSLVEGRALTPADAREMAAAAQLQADRAIDRAHGAPGPSPEALMSYIYSPDSAALYRRGATPPGHRTTYAGAVNEALAAALTSDPTTYVIGSGLAGGGRFGTLHGLPERFGHNRVIDAPISPNVIVGSAVTAAAAGQRPIIEMGIAEFLTLAADPIVNDAAKLRYASNGQYRVPLVIRVANGPGQGWGPHQSQSLEAWFSSIPGLLVAVPTTPYDAKGLLTAAIRSNNPVLVFESKALYPMLGQVPPDGVVVPLGVADVKRRGDDCTVVGIGAAVHEALAAAEMLAEEGLGVEVIDPRTLVPFDWTTVLDSVARTGRLVVAEETPPLLGWSAEIAAQVSRHLHGVLRAPVERVSAAAVPLPYSPSLARLALAGADGIAEAVRRAMGR